MPLIVITDGVRLRAVMCIISSFKDLMSGAASTTSVPITLPALSHVMRSRYAMDHAPLSPFCAPFPSLTLSLPRRRWSRSSNQRPVCTSGIVRRCFQRRARSSFERDISAVHGRCIRVSLSARPVTSRFAGVCARPCRSASKRNASPRKCPSSHARS